MSELEQILSNLVLGDNAIRAEAEAAVNERLATNPDMYLLALAQFATTATTTVMRSFSFVLLRRLLFRGMALYDQLPSPTLDALEGYLLHALTHELAPRVRKDAVDTICDVANHAMLRGRPWHSLQSQAFALSTATTDNPGMPPAVLLRESAFRVFAGAPNLITDLHIEGILPAIRAGLADPQSVNVRYAALLAAVSYISAAELGQIAQCSPLVISMLDTLPNLAENLHNDPLGVDPQNPQPGSKTSNYQYLSTFLSTLTPLCTTHPMLLAPHLHTLLGFLPPLILPFVDSGPTPTVSRPFPTNGPRSGAFIFPPPASDPSTSNTSYDDDDTDGDNDERSTLRLTALEFMLSLTEAKPSVVKKVSGWAEIMVKACLEGMSEIDEDREPLEQWLREDPSASSSSDDSPPALYEQSLDRLAIALGGRSVLPPAFQTIPSMLLAYDWRTRHAGLIAIASIAEGTGSVMLKELDSIVDMVIPLFKDVHPRVRHAACQCVGQLCSDLEAVMQERYHGRLLEALVSTLEDKEPRVHAHAASALINFCEGVERDTLLPYLDPLVDRLLKLLNPPESTSSTPSGAPSSRYVQEQAITTLAMVADASSLTFAKHYPTLMPLLLNILRNATGPEYTKLRAKAMECAGLVAIAVGPDVFRPDASTLVELLLRLQQTPPDPNDTQLSHYLMATWAKVCQAMGREFEPYLPVVMPTLLAVATAKADLSPLYDDDERPDDDDIETIILDGRSYAVRTSAMDDKCQAFETLVIYTSTLGPLFAPYLAQSLQITLPCLKFIFHEGVREACAMLLPMFLSCGKLSNTLTDPMVNAIFVEMINCINSEQDMTFLASLYRYFGECVRVIGGKECVRGEFWNGISEATKRQLLAMADRRKARAGVASGSSESGGGNGSSTSTTTSTGTNGAAAVEEMDKDEITLMEEIEDYALEEIAKTLVMMDKNHPLLFTVAGVRDLGLSRYDSEVDEDEE